VGTLEEGEGDPGDGGGDNEEDFLKIMVIRKEVFAPAD